MLSSMFSEWLRLPATDVLIDACVKSSILLAFTGIAAYSLRHASAAVRHRLWCLGFCGVVVLPLLSLTLPQWRLPLLPAPEVAVATRSDFRGAAEKVSTDLTPDDIRNERGALNESTTSAPHERIELNNMPALSGEHTVEEFVAFPRETTTQQIAAELPVEQEHTSIRTWLVGAWITGLTIVLVPFAIGLAGNSWTLFRSKHVHTSKWTQLVEELATKLGLARRVTLLESPESIVPMTWGVVRPIVLLPSESRQWNDERRRIVLLHELAHVKRLDVLFQSIARFACALYWFNPLAWYALWRLRVERELACDDCVVAAGERASDYASQLLEIARAYRSLRFSVGVAMARSTKLEDRIVAMLDRARSHVPVGKQLARTLLAGACVLVLGLSVIGLGERTVTSAEEDQNNAANDNDGKLASTTKLVRGTVIDESGKTIANAEVFAVLNSRERNTWTRQNQVVAKTKTDRIGQFEIEVPRHDDMTLGNQYRTTHSISLLATASRFGPDTFDEVDQAKPEDEITLELVKDTVPLEGRVVNLEGRPLAGVELRVRSITTTAADLDAWIARALHNPTSLPDNTRMANQMRSQMAYFPSEKGIQVDGLPMFPAVKTDASGRFRIDGLGSDRYISLEVHGDMIAKEWIGAVTRSMPTVPLPARDPRSRSDRCFGAKFDYTAEPMQIITGIVRDQDSQEPLAGAVVEVGQFGGSLLSVLRFVSATTDARGRYRLVGLPKQPDGARPIRLEVSPNSDQPYFRTDVTMSTKAEGLGPVKFDIELKRAALVTGRLIDQQTDESVVGYVSYFPYVDNAVAADYSNFHAGRTSVGHDDWYRTAKDGSYRVPAIRGRGVVVAKAAAAPNYRIAHGADKIGWKSQPRDQLVYHLHGPEVANSVREVNIAGDEAKGQDIALVPLSRQQIRLIDRAGQPVMNVRVGGWRPSSALNETDEFHRARPGDGSSVDLLGLAMDGRRLILFSQDDRKLGKVIVADRTTESVTLEPHGTFTGRLVGAKGTPLEGRYVNAVIPQSESPEPNDKRAWGRRRHYLAGANTDATGRFRFDDVLPGAKYELHVNNETIATHEIVEPGEVIDFGDLKVTSDEDDDQASAGVVPSGKVVAKKEPLVTNLTGDKPASFVIAGRVLNPDGKPLPKAKLYFAPHQGATQNDLQVRGVSDARGRFSFSVPLAELNRLAEGLQAPRSHPRTAARFEGYGPDWQYVVKPEESNDLTLRLVKDDVPIQGRIVTLEGNPVPNAMIHVLQIKASPQEKLDEWLDELDHAGELWSQETFKLTKSVKQNASGLPVRVSTDQQGRFELTGIGRERVVDLRVEGPAIETQEFSVMTRHDKDIRVPFDKQEPSYGTLICYGASFSHATAPSRQVVGKLLDAKSGEPISGVTVFCRKRAGNPVHGRRAPETVTDADGNFLLTGLPKGPDNKIQFVPTADQPYLPMVKTFDTRDGLDPLLVDVQMSRGALIRGRVTDKSTGAPVAGARIEYFSLRNENAVIFEGFRDSDNITSTTDADGRYQIVGLPGRGLVAVRADSDEFAAGHAIDTVKEDSRLETGIRDRAFLTAPTLCLASHHHAVAVVEAQENIETMRDVPLERGNVVKVTIAGPDGRPLTGVEVNRRGLAACQWRGGEVELEASEFSVSGLTAGQSRTLVLRHRDKGLAASRILRHDDPSPVEIRLEPAGTIIGRLLDQGKPAAFVSFTASLAKPQTQQNDWLRTTSDAKGEFRIEGLVPETGYHLGQIIRTNEGYRLSSLESEEPIALSVPRGETLDLGNVLVE